MENTWYNMPHIIKHFSVFTCGKECIGKCLVIARLVTEVQEYPLVLICFNRHEFGETFMSRFFDGVGRNLQLRRGAKDQEGTISCRIIISLYFRRVCSETGD